MEPAGPPLPSGPWHDWQFAAYTCAPLFESPCRGTGIWRRARGIRCASPAFADAGDHNVDLMIGQVPPALCANGGIAVPGTPLAMTRRIEASSMIAR